MMDFIFQNLTKGKNILLLACLFLIFNLLLNHFMPKDHALDLKFAYSVEEAYLALGSLDLEARKIYRTGIWLFDMPYMVVYSLLFSGILLKLWGTKRLVLLPFLVLLMDFLENLMILRMLRIFPRGDDYLAGFSSLFSTCKWLLIAVMLITVCLGVKNLIGNRKYSSFESPETEI